MVDTQGLADFPTPAAGDYLFGWRGIANYRLNLSVIARKDLNGNLSFGADPSGSTLPLRYGYWAGFLAAGGSDPGFSYEPIDTDQHRLSILNNAFQTGNGSYTNILAYRVSGASATAYSSNSGQHIFKAADPGTAGQNISWRNQLILQRNGTALFSLGATIGGASDTVQINSLAGRALFARTEAGAATDVAFLWNSAATGNNSFLSFATDVAGSIRGSISYNRSAGLTAYYTTSDYRAKKDLGPINNHEEIIDLLRPFMGMMNGAECARPMLSAHEVADAGADYCVTGKKDAVDKEGEPIFQQLDLSPLIPLLVVAIQSLRARVASLGG
jgi:hypothetical protein